MIIQICHEYMQKLENQRWQQLTHPHLLPPTSPEGEIWDFARYALIHFFSQLMVESDNPQALVTPAVVEPGKEPVSRTVWSDYFRFDDIRSAICNFIGPRFQNFAQQEWSIEYGKPHKNETVPQ